MFRGHMLPRCLQEPAVLRCLYRPQVAKAYPTWARARRLSRVRLAARPWRNHQWKSFRSEQPPRLHRTLAQVVFGRPEALQVALACAGLPCSASFQLRSCRPEERLAECRRASFLGATVPNPVGSNPVSEYLPGRVAARFWLSPLALRGRREPRRSATLPRRCKGRSPGALGWPHPVFRPGTKARSRRCICRPRQPVPMRFPMPEKTEIDRRNLQNPGSFFEPSRLSRRRRVSSPLRAKDTEPRP